MLHLLIFLCLVLHVSTCAWVCVHMFMKVLGQPWGTFSTFFKTRTLIGLELTKQAWLGLVSYTWKPSNLCLPTTEITSTHHHIQNYILTWVLKIKLRTSCCWVGGCRVTLLSQQSHQPRSFIHSSFNVDRVLVRTALKTGHSSKRQALKARIRGSHWLSPLCTSLRQSV